MNPLRPCLCCLTSVAAVVLLAGCSSLYYGTMEKFGFAKRDILVDRVEEARESQKEAKEQFKTALERFHEVVKVQPSELSAKYGKLKTEYDRSETRAKEVHDRIAAVEEVALSLFAEWKTELKQYSSSSLRDASERKLTETRRRYDQYLAAMKRAETKIAPVLSALKDQVLFLKHNLNAQAVASLQTELVSVETNTQSLVRDMDAAIREADTFLQSMAEK